MDRQTNTTAKLAIQTVRVWIFVRCSQQPASYHAAKVARQHCQCCCCCCCYFCFYFCRHLYRPR